MPLSRYILDNRVGPKTLLAHPKVVRVLVRSDTTQILQDRCLDQNARLPTVQALTSCEQNATYSISTLLELLCIKEQFFVSVAFLLIFQSVMDQYFSKIQQRCCLNTVAVPNCRKVSNCLLFISVLPALRPHIE